MREHPRILCLYGELGAGKTTFVRGLAESIGVKSRVNSPTFTYQRIYKGDKTRLYHFDFYRIRGPDLMLLSTLYEALEAKDALIAIEWAEKIERDLPRERLDIYFSLRDSDSRTLTFSPHD